MNNDFILSFNKVVLVAIILFLGTLVAKPFYVYLTGGSKEIVVENKERVCNGSGQDNCRYLIWTKDNEVYENTDSILRVKFDSSNIYGKIDEGQTYKIDYYGWRVPLFSWYPNIYNINEMR